MGNNSLSNLNKNMETPLAASQDLVSFIQNWAQELWFQINSWGFLYQVIAVVTIIILGIIISRFALAHLKKVTEERPNIGYLQNLKYFAVKSGWAIASVILLWITEAAFCRPKPAPWLFAHCGRLVKRLDYREFGRIGHETGLLVKIIRSFHMDGGRAVYFAPARSGCHIS